MKYLQKIQDFAVQTADTIAAALGVEVVLIDSNLQIVAATGIYGNEIGFYVGQNTLSSHILKQQEGLVVVNPRLHALCQQCTRRGCCPDAAELCFPIMLDGEVIGVLILVALNQDQRNILLGQEEKLIQFGQWLAELFSGKVRTNGLQEKDSQFIENTKEEENTKTEDRPILSLAIMEKEALIMALQQLGTSSAGKLAVCQALGISIATFYRKVKEYGINIREGKFPVK